MNKPVLYFIAGPNGCGKSTLVDALLKKLGDDIPYICPDKEALLLSDIVDKEEKDYKAWENARKKREDMIRNHISFINETVFSHDSHIDFLKEAKQNGYDIISFYVVLESADICIERVKKRISEGGHGVDFDKVGKRYERSLALLPKLIEISDSCTVIDNTNKYEPIFYKQKNSYISLKRVNWFDKKVIKGLEEAGYSITVLE